MTWIAREANGAIVSVRRARAFHARVIPNQHESSPHARFPRVSSLKSRCAPTLIHPLASRSNALDVIFMARTVGASEK